MIPVASMRHGTVENGRNAFYLVLYSKIFYFRMAFHPKQYIFRMFSLQSFQRTFIMIMCRIFRITVSDLSFVFIFSMLFLLILGFRRFFQCCGFVNVFPLFQFAIYDIESTKRIYRRHIGRTPIGSNNGCECALGNGYYVSAYLPHTSTDRTVC